MEYKDIRYFDTILCMKNLTIRKQFEHLQSHSKISKNDYAFNSVYFINIQN